MNEPFAFQGRSLAQRIAGRFGELGVVQAVALAGSAGAGAGDARSDIDLYVYAEAELPLAFRAALAAGDPSASLGNTFFEPGDEWTDAETGIGVDVMFRRPAWIEDRLAAVLERHEAAVGYSTCFWRNVLDSTVLFDRAGWFGRLQARARAPYPEPLRRAVLARNVPLLAHQPGSFSHQLEVALARADSVAANHRAAAFLASFFDALFALNRRPHPGEKRLLAYAGRECPLRPPHLAERVSALIAAAGRGDGAAGALARALAADLERLALDHGPPPPACAQDARTPRECTPG